MKITRRNVNETVIEINAKEYNRATIFVSHIVRRYLCNEFYRGSTIILVDNQGNKIARGSIEINIENYQRNSIFSTEFKVNGSYTLNGTKTYFKMESRKKFRHCETSSSPFTGKEVVDDNFFKSEKEYWEN